MMKGKFIKRLLTLTLILPMSTVMLSNMGNVNLSAAPQNRRGNSNYVSNQGELIQDELVTLPLGAVKAEGWLEQQLLLQKERMTGAMESFPDYSSDSAWLGGSGEDWERGPYYVRGLVALAYTLDDEELINKAQKWIDWSIESQRPDGFFGPRSNTDWWPRMPMLMAIRDYYAATVRRGNPDERVIPFMTKYFEYQAQKLPSEPLVSWAAARGGDNIDSVYWLYNMTYDESNPEATKWLLDLATLIKSQTQDWTRIFNDTTVREHVVNTSQALKMPILYYQQSQSQGDRDAFMNSLFNISIDHGRIDGLPNSDEAARDNKSTRGTETCGVVESMLSTEIAMRITGDSSLGDNLERMAYNSLPAAYSSDYYGHVYFALQNQVLATNGYHEFDCDHGDSSAFGAPNGFDCCFSNNHMGWPKYVQNMWMATDDNGLAIVTYGPNTVNAKVADGKNATFTQITDYPFNDAIVIDYTGDKAQFPLILRVPEWCENPSIKVNGKAQEGMVTGEFFTLNREWASGDKIEIQFPMTIETSTWYNDSVAVERGPLIYSLKVEEDWRMLSDDDARELKVPAKGGMMNREVYPASRWNYGLIVDEENPESSFTVVEKNVNQQPFNYSNSPIILKAKGQVIPEWNLDGNIAAAQPFGYTPYNESLVEDIELIPYGSARLKITHFPKIGEPNDIIKRDDVKISTSDSGKVQGIDNVVVPTADDYTLNINYTGTGTLNLIVNGKANKTLEFTEESGKIAVENLRSLIRDRFFKFDAGQYNNLKFVGDDAVTINSIEVVSTGTINTPVISKITSTSNSVSITTNVDREIAPYKIVYGTESNNYEFTASGFNSKKAVITGLEPDKTYYFKVVAYLNGKEVSSDEHQILVTGTDNVNSNTDVDFADDFSNEAFTSSKWNKFGSTNKIEVSDGKLNIGKDPDVKATVIGGEGWTDYVYEATIQMDSGDTNNAGLIFRGTGIAAGPDGYNGYYFGIGKNGVMVGYADGAWHEIAIVDHPIAAGNDYRLKAVVSGDKVGLYVDDKLVYKMQDSLYAAGTVGLRSYNEGFTADDVNVRAVEDSDLVDLKDFDKVAAGFEITGTTAFEAIQVKYPKINGATSYKISYGTESGVYTDYIYDITFNPYKGSNPFTADKTSFTVDNDTKYYVKMTALNNTREISSSSELVIETISYGQKQAPTGIVGVDPTSLDATDGSITGVSSGMEYRADEDIMYTPVSASEITNLAAGTYYVRYQKTADESFSFDTEVMVGSDPEDDTDKQSKKNSIFKTIMMLVIAVVLVGAGVVGFKAVSKRKNKN